ncbi:hypothetical protein ACN08Y_10445 [Rothia sp. P5764]|uniref:hypothetical protein n=1 Tax=Rothia sp. P5764 TaxID=3402654 RepID=UPI003AC35BD1
MSNGNIQIYQANGEYRLGTINTTAEEALAAQQIIQETYHANHKAIIFLLNGNEAYKLSPALPMIFRAGKTDAKILAKQLDRIRTELEAKGSITLSESPQFGLTPAVDTEEAQEKIHFQEGSKTSA